MGQVNPDSKNKNGWTPVAYAAGFRHEAVVKLLLDISKSNMDVEDSGDRKPLSWTVENRHEALVTLLLEYAAIKDAVVASLCFFYVLISG